MLAYQLAVTDVCAYVEPKITGLCPEGGFKAHLSQSVRLPSNGSVTSDLVAFDINVSMSNSSRKVKNPLLSAAGPDFRLENYTENAFVRLVTPVTSEMPRDGEFAFDKSAWVGLGTLQFSRIV